jgi:predicted nucleotidyltransferase component of viral defense system
MSEKTKNYGKSVRSKLLNVSKKAGVFYQTVLTRYFQELILYRLAQTQYRDHFFLKGGALFTMLDIIELTSIPGCE